MRVQYAALMHDAHEAYVGDVGAPLKTLLPGFRDVEERVRRAVLQAFSLTGFPDYVWERVQRYDEDALSIEAAELFPLVLDVGS